MLINSLEFWIFFAVIFLVYYLIRNNRWQNAWLAVTSLAFYGYVSIKLLALFAVIIVLFYGLALGTEKKRESSPATVKWFKVAGVCAGLGVLIYFKYLNFFIAEFSSLLNSIGLPATTGTLNIIAPLGISYFTFKLISYIVDVAHGKTQAEHDAVKFTAYVAFFPTLMSGPIDRATTFLPQLEKARKLLPSNLGDGSLRILWGFFMKACIADRIAPYTDAIFNNISHHNATSIALASVLYLIQMYSDFAGYSHMAIGVGRLLGLTVTENFKQPFFSVNGGDFWRRWHMSLSFWLRDYIYIPLGGSRCSKMRSYFNVMVTFIACGAWHGANWTYIIFGAHHGLWVIASRLMKSPREQLEARYASLKHSTWFKSVRIAISFLVCCIGAMYFRANSIGDIVVAWRKWLSRDWGTPYLQATVPLFTFGLLSFLVMIYKEHQDEYQGKAHFMHSSSRAMRLACIAMTIVFIILTGALESDSFIYVQF